MFQSKSQRVSVCLPPITRKEGLTDIEISSLFLFFFSFFFFFPLFPVFVCLVGKGERFPRYRLNPSFPSMEVSTQIPAVILIEHFADIL